MEKWFAECINMENDIVILTTRAFTKDQAIENFGSMYRVKEICSISDKPLFKTPIQGYISSSLAGVL